MTTTWQHAYTTTSASGAVLPYGNMATAPGYPHHHPQAAGLTSPTTVFQNHAMTPMDFQQFYCSTSSGQGTQGASPTTSEEYHDDDAKAGKGGARRYKTPSPQILRLRRQAANARERKRMNMLNTAFDTLRDHIPEIDKGRRLSKMETLLMAHYYIQELVSLLETDKTE
uniref:BHLH domain-containing protein n=1 Tax=Steinernema glaseri TaxID=37863 RepID=A0A1I7ZE74_9BILA